MSSTSAFTLSPMVSDEPKAAPRSASSRRRLRILWVKADPLHPLDSGGKIRTFQMLKAWHQQHHITYVSLFAEGTPSEAREHARSYSSAQVFVPWRERPKRSAGFYLELLGNLLFSRLPYVIDKYRSKAAVQTIRTLWRESNFDLVIADFLSMTPNIVDAGVDMGRTIVFQHNVESQIWKRHFETARNPLTRAYMGRQWRRYDRFEREMCSRFRGVIAVSEDDASRFRGEFGLRNVLGDVPTGVDVEFFGAVAREAQPREIVFLGSMDWMPNIDGVVEFARTSYAAIKAREPGVTLTIVGRRPSPAVLALAESDPSIRVTGTVPDVRPYMARATVSVVPLRVGGGTRIKIFEAMAMGIPVVSTTIGAEGLPVRDGHDILIADRPEHFAEQVLALLSDPQRAQSIGRAGRQLVRERYSWQSAVDRFDRMCEQALESPASLQKVTA